MNIYTSRVAAILTFFMLFPAALHAKDFQVSDYGAVGDGKTDDGPAVRRAVAAAINAGPGSTVVFEKRPYRLARYKNEPYHISLRDISGITLEGNGAEIINNPYNCIVNIKGCSNVTVRGFYFDCDPLPFTQGTITKVEPDQGVFFLKLHDGYDNPVKVYREIGKRPDWGWGVCMDPVMRQRKLEAQMHFYMKDVTEAIAGNNLLRVELDANSVRDARDIKTGDRYVITLKYGGHGANINVSQSSEIRLEDNTIYTAKYGMTHVFTDNPGRVYVKGVQITFKPDSDRLISTPKDGFHVKHNAVGPVIEDGLFEGMLDDTINISVCPYWVKKDLGGNQYLIAELGHSPRAGDTLMAYTPNTGTVTYDLKVLTVQSQERPKGQQGNWNIITLNQPIPGLGLQQDRNLFPGGHDKLKCTGLYNIDASGKDYIIRNNTFLAQRRHAVLARTTGGLIEGNTIDGVGGCGVNLGNEVGSFYEGPFPGRTVIRNNVFRNTVGTSINVYTHGTNAWATGIAIENNTISGWPTAAIELSNVDNGIIEGNTIESGKGTPSESSPIIAKNSRKLRVENNTVTDDRPDLASVYDFSTGVDGDTLVMAGNREGLHNEFPAIMKTIPPVSIQLRGQRPRRGHRRLSQDRHQPSAWQGCPCLEPPPSIQE